MARETALQFHLFQHPGHFRRSVMLGNVETDPLIRPRNSPGDEEARELQQTVNQTERYRPNQNDGGTEISSAFRSDMEGVRAASRTGLEIKRLALRGEHQISADEYPQ